MARGALVCLVVAVAACSCSTKPASSELPACTWPASLNPPDAGYSWSIGRALVQCTGDCVTEVCVSDDPTSCPGGGDGVGGGSTCTPSAGSSRTCVDACKPNEYGFMDIGAGPVGPYDGGAASQAPSIPSACYHPLGVALSAGGPSLCCPCV